MTASPQANESQVAAPQQDSKEINFEKIRKQLEQERSEKQKLAERLEKLEKAQTQRHYSSPDDDEPGDEPYVDYKRLDKKFKRFEDDIEKKIEAKAEEKARSMLEMEKQQSYIKQNPDFQQVLTAEGIENFAKSHPAIAERMLRMPDTFDRQALLYEQIKAFNLAKKDAESKPSIQQTIDQNRKNAFYQPSGMGSAPYAPQGDYSDGGKKAAYAKMKELIAKRRG